MEHQGIIDKFRSRKVSRVHRYLSWIDAVSCKTRLRGRGRGKPTSYASSYDQSGGDCEQTDLVHLISPCPLMRCHRWVETGTEVAAGM